MITRSDLELDQAALIVRAKLDEYLSTPLFAKRAQAVLDRINAGEKLDMDALAQALDINVEFITHAARMMAAKLHVPENGRIQ